MHKETPWIPLFLNLEKQSKCSNCATCSSPFFFDHILANVSNRISRQNGVVDDILSNNQLMFPQNSWKNLKLLPLTSYLWKGQEKPDFPNYELFEDIDQALKTWFERAWQLLIILCLVKTSAFRVHHNNGLMLKL